MPSMIGMIWHEIMLNDGDDDGDDGEDNGNDDSNDIADDENDRLQRRDDDDAQKTKKTMRKCFKNGPKWFENNSKRSKNGWKMLRKQFESNPETVQRCSKSVHCMITTPNRCFLEQQMSMDIVRPFDRLTIPTTYIYIQNRLSRHYRRNTEVRIPGIYPCVRSIPLKSKKNFFIF